MSKRSNLALFQAFEDLTLDPASFKHIDHIAVAYMMLRKYDFAEAVLRYSTNIRAIANRAGDASGFNMTITVAFISLIAERMQLAPHKNVEDLLRRNPDLMSSDLLKIWYSADRLKSDMAKHSFLMPDIAAGHPT